MTRMKRSLHIIIRALGSMHSERFDRHLHSTLEVTIVRVYRHRLAMHQPSTLLWPALGVMRLLLALVVAAGHLPGFSGQIAYGFGAVSFLQQFPATGAVLIFFVISGYSIAASYEKEREQFYFRRALRIMPLYLLLVTASAVIPIFFGNVVIGPIREYETPSYIELAENLCFTQGFFYDAINTNSVVWSLSLEVFFYAVTPWLMNRSNREIGFAIIASSSVFVGVCILDGGHIVPKGHGINVLTLGWPWLLGFWVRRLGSNRFSLLFALAAGLLVLPFTPAKWIAALWASTILILAVGHKYRLPRFVSGAFSLCGDVSYPLYLAHIPIFILLLALNQKPDGWSVAAVVLISFALDQLYDRPVKRVVRNLYERFARSRGPEWSLHHIGRPTYASRNVTPNGQLDKVAAETGKLSPKSSVCKS